MKSRVKFEFASRRSYRRISRAWRRIWELVRAEASDFVMRRSLKNAASKNKTKKSPLEMCTTG